MGIFNTQVHKHIFTAIWFRSWMATSLSINVDKYVSLETGQKFFSTSNSRSDFFKSGTNKAFFRSVGTTPSDKDRLTTFVMNGRRGSRHCFKSEVGIGSCAHDLLLVAWIIFFTSCSLTGWNVPQVGKFTLSLSWWSILDIFADCWWPKSSSLIFKILFTKQRDITRPVEHFPAGVKFEAVTVTQLLSGQLLASHNLAVWFALYFDTEGILFMNFYCAISCLHSSFDLASLSKLHCHHDKICLPAVSFKQCFYRWVTCCLLYHIAILFAENIWCFRYRECWL